MLRYLSLEILCSSKLTVFLGLRFPRFSEQIMSADNYPSIFSRQMEAIVPFIRIQWDVLKQCMYQTLETVFHRDIQTQDFTVLQSPIFPWYRRCSTGRHLGFLMRAKLGRASTHGHLHCHQFCLHQENMMAARQTQRSTSKISRKNSRLYPNTHWGVLKIQRAAVVWIADDRCNSVSSVWYIFSIETKTKK